MAGNEHQKPIPEEVITPQSGSSESEQMDDSVEHSVERQEVAKTGELTLAETQQLVSLIERVKGDPDSFQEAMLEIYKVIEDLPQDNEVKQRADSAILNFMVNNQQLKLNPEYSAEFLDVFAKISQEYGDDETWRETIDRQSSRAVAAAFDSWNFGPAIEQAQKSEVDKPEADTSLAQQLESKFKNDEIEHSLPSQKDQAEAFASSEESEPEVVEGEGDALSVEPSEPEEQRIQEEEAKEQPAEEVVIVPEADPETVELQRELDALEKQAEDLSEDIVFSWDKFKEKLGKEVDPEAVGVAKLDNMEDAKAWQARAMEAADRMNKQEAA